jgi:outer membrane lipoprotein-sorting protein
MKRFVVVISSVAIAIAFAVVARGQNAPTVDSASLKAGGDAFTRLATLYKAPTSLHYTAHMTLQGKSAAGVATTTLLDEDVIAQKPNKVLITISQDGKALGTVACDGATLTAYNSMNNKYIKEPAPEKAIDGSSPLGKKLDKLAGPVLGACNLEDTIFLDGPDTVWTFLTNTPGVALHSAPAANTDKPGTDVTVDAGKLVVHVVLDTDTGYVDHVSFKAADDKGSMNADETVTKVTTGTDLPAATFTYAPPAGATLLTDVPAPAPTN